MSISSVLFFKVMWYFLVICLLQYIFYYTVLEICCFQLVIELSTSVNYFRSLKWQQI